MLRTTMKADDERRVIEALADQINGIAAGDVSFAELADFINQQ